MTLGTWIGLGLLFGLLTGHAMSGLFWGFILGLIFEGDNNEKIK